MTFILVHTILSHQYLLFPSKTFGVPHQDFLVEENVSDVLVQVSTAVTENENKLRSQK